MSSNSQESAVLNGSYNYNGHSSPSEDSTERRLILPVDRAPDDRRPLRVLIADDYRDAADTMAALVNAWGHEARVAYDGAVALQMALAYRPDVLLLDIALPLIDGYRLARQLSVITENEETLLIAVTGYADEAHRLLGMKAGFHHYLAKPVEPKILKNLLYQAHCRLEKQEEIAVVERWSNDFLIVDEEVNVRGVLV